MATTFPTALDQYDPVPRNQNQAVKHHDRHQNVEDAIEAIEGYVGISSSTDPATLTGGLKAVIGNPGGTNVKFLQSGTGAVLRDLQAKVRECVTPQDYGAVADGVTDDTTAINRAVAYAISVGKLSISLPAGRYRITSKIDIALPGFKGFSFEGEGMGVTEVLVDYAGGNGFEITAAAGNYWLDVDQHAAVRLANFTLVTNRVDVGTGILINGGSLMGRPPQACVFDHVEFRGATSFFHAFSLCVDLLDTASVQFIGCRWICGGPGVNTADGVRIRASSSGTAPTEIKFTDCEWYFCDIAVNAGDYVEGLYFNNPSMVNCNKGIRYVTTTGESGMAVNGGHFNNYSRNIEVENVFDISITGPIMFHADSSAGFRHISLKDCGAFTVQGHVIRGASTDVGIYVESVPVGWGGAIGPGYYSGIDTAVYCDTNSRNVTVKAGSYNSITSARFTDFGTSNVYEGTQYAARAQTTFTGGTAVQSFTVAIPSGVFLTTPRFADCRGASANDAFGYNYAASTPTSLTFQIKEIDGVAIPNPTVYSFSVFASE